jgi:hypothetical protein
MAKPQSRGADLRQLTKTEKRVDVENRQICILHALRYLLLTLWGEGMSKDDRLNVEAAVKQALFTLVNSTKKRLKDKDKEKTNCRRELTRRLESSKDR